MSAVLTTSSRITCAAQGSVQVSSSALLRVNGSPVLLQSSIASKSISGCTHPVDSSKGVKNCAAVAGFTSPGLAAKLTAGGSAVVLSTMTAIGDSTPPPPDAITAQALQTKLTAV